MRQILMQATPSLVSNIHLCELSKEQSSLIHAPT